MHHGRWRRRRDVWCFDVDEMVAREWLHGFDGVDAMEVVKDFIMFYWEEWNVLREIYGVRKC